MFIERQILAGPAGTPTSPTPLKENGKKKKEGVKGLNNSSIPLVHNPHLSQCLRTNLSHPLQSPHATS